MDRECDIHCSEKSSMADSPSICRAAGALLGLLFACAPARSQVAESAETADLAQLKADYASVSALVIKHHGSDAMFLDNDPGSPALLAKQWSLAGRWVATWLDMQRNATADELKRALNELTSKETPEVLTLDATSFLVASPGDFSNFFIVTRNDGRYRVAWNIADPQPVKGKQAELLAAWHAQNAIDQARDVRTARPIEAASGNLPADAKGHPRFYIDGTYTEPAGIVVPAQTSVWQWDGSHAQLLWIDRYGVDIDRSVRG